MCTLHEEHFVIEVINIREDFVETFYYQLMHIMLKCFGLHRNHLQGADDALHIFYADTVNQMRNF